MLELFLLHLLYNNKEMISMSENVEQYQKRYGNIAIENGFITSEQLIEALNIQVTDEINGVGHRLIGVILIGLGYISLEQDIEVFNSLAKG